MFQIIPRDVPAVVATSTDKTSHAGEVGVSVQRNPLDLQIIGSLRWSGKSSSKKKKTVATYFRVGNHMLKLYRHALRMADNRRPKRTSNWLQEGRKRKGRPEMKWEE